MSDSSKLQTGSIVWTDLTVKDADRLSRFYEKVAGWKREAVSMGEYNDFNMLKPQNNEVVSGVCHAKGTNASIPSQWLIYIAVDDLDECMRICEQEGGRVLTDTYRSGQDGKFCVIQDPEGAVCALYQMA
ncbi:MAG: VOC family protein [Caldithrix sp.]|nr:VOC family protein [Caldithrix sp.]